MKLSIIGAVVGVIGFIFFQTASRIIEQGDAFFGLGWAFQEASPEQATLLQYLGIFGMAVGVIMVLAGLIRMTQRENQKSSDKEKDNPKS